MRKYIGILLVGVLIFLFLSVPAFAAKPTDPGSNPLDAVVAAIETLKTEVSNLWEAVTGLGNRITLIETNYISSESDPSVLLSVKDGVSWNEVTDKPGGFNDGIDNTGSGFSGYEIVKITYSEQVFTANNYKTFVITAPVGKIVIGGGSYAMERIGFHMVSSWPGSKTEWKVIYQWDGTAGVNTNEVTIYAICVDDPSP